MSAPKKRPAVTAQISRRFSGDFGVRAVTELLNAVLGLYTFSVLSRLLKDSGDYAVINQVIAMFSLVVPLLLARMNTALCVFLPGDTDKSRVKSRFGTVFLITLAVCALLCVALVALDGTITRVLWNDPSYDHLTPLMAAYYSVAALSTLCQSLYQAIGQQKKSNLFVLLRCLLTAAGFTYLGVSSAVEFNLRHAMWIYLLAESIVLATALVCLGIDGYGIASKPSFSALRPLYRYALPLLPVTLLAWVNSFIGRFLLNHLVDDELRSASIYGFYDALTSRAFLINAVLVYTVFPYMAKAWNDHNRQLVVVYLHKSFNIGLLIGVPITFGLALVCPTLVHWMGDGNYPTDQLLVVVLCLAQLCQMMYMNFSYLIDLSRRTQWYNGIFLLSSLVNLGVCLWLIPLCGYLGSAIGLLVSYALQMGVGAFISHRVAGISIAPDLLQAAKAFLSAGVMTLICQAIYYQGGDRPVGGTGWFILTVTVGIASYFGCQWLLSRLTRTKII